MRVLFASSEIFPLAKTGGLADVSAGLPAALAMLGVDIRLVMPGYPRALDAAERKGPSIPLGDIIGFGDTAVIPARMPDTGLPLLLVDCPELFRRPGGPYADTDGKDWPDNSLRFALFSHAVVRAALGPAGIRWRPDVVHLNDWHLSLVPALLAARSRRRPRTVLTIHNLAFQGVFPAEVFPRLGLPGELFNSDGLEFHGRVSFLKAGIRFADRLTTVSPSYAREILTPEFGCGLDGLLRTRSNDLVGILNGIDYRHWTSEDSSVVPFPYSSSDMSGKRHCKADLQMELGLATDAEGPLIAFVSRFTEQKMADLLPDVVPSIAYQGAQLAICGEGDRAIEHALRAIARQYPRQVVMRLGYEEALARRMLAGADILAAPSRFEPCGLIQMYAMRYGTLPIVRRVGGLADTVVGHDNDEIVPGREPTGFMFEEPTADALGKAVENASRLYREPDVWRAMQKQAMRQDFGWRRSAERYLDLYSDCVAAENGTAAAVPHEEAEAELLPTGT